MGAAGPPRAVSAMQAHGEGPPGLAGLLPQGPGPQAKQSRSRGGRHSLGPAASRGVCPGTVLGTPRVCSCLSLREMRK